MFWDFSEHKVAHFLLSHYGISEDLLPPIAHTFSIQGQIRSGAAKELGLKEGIPVAYRAGDQPNNALSLNVFEPGEIAATAGTSGVVYGVSDVVKYDPQSRVNTFAHVNHTREQNRLGVLLCINGTGILNSWLKRNSGFSGYDEMNDAARAVPIGSDGVVMIPFGNGAERMLGNTDPGAGIAGLNFNRHNRAHLARAAQEGIVFSLHYGMEIMKETGIHPSVIRAGKANMFLSDIFKNSLANLTGATIELFNTDGSHGAALGAALGTGFYKTPREAFQGLKKVEVVEPDESKSTACQVAYSKWLKVLQAQMQR
jgi:xylulokinase